MRDLSARTTLYQSRHGAVQSAIVAAMERDDMAEAPARMLAHIGNGEEALQTEQVEPSQAEKLRAPIIRPRPC